MATRLSRQPYLAGAAWEQRYRTATDPVARGHGQRVWLRAQGLPSERVAAVTGYTAHWVRTIAHRYHQHGPPGLGDRRHRNPGSAGRLAVAPRGWPPHSGALGTPTGAGRGSSASADTPKGRDHGLPRPTQPPRVPVTKAPRGHPHGAAHLPPRCRRAVDDRPTPPGPQAHPAPRGVPPRAAPPGRGPASVPVVLSVCLCPSPLGADVLAAAPHGLDRRGHECPCRVRPRGGRWAGQAAPPGVRRRGLACEPAGARAPQECIGTCCHRTRRRYNQPRGDGPCPMHRWPIVTSRTSTPCQPSRPNVVSRGRRCRQSSGPTPPCMGGRKPPNYMAIIQI